MSLEDAWAAIAGACRAAVSRARSCRQTLTDRQRGLLAIVTTALVVGLAFGIWPLLDLRVSALFYDAVHNYWPWARMPTVLALRSFNEFVTRAIVAAAVIALIFTAVGGRASAFIAPRVALFLLAALALGPGLIANGIFKAHWSRPRPGEVSAFGGPLDFVPWWSPFGNCAGNCSFVSGEVASATCLLAVALVLPVRFRRRAITAVIGYVLAIALMRVAMGGHFLSDALFAGIFTALAIWLLHWAMFPER